MDFTLLEERQVEFSDDSESNEFERAVASGQFCFTDEGEMEDRPSKKRRTNASALPHRSHRLWLLRRSLLILQREARWKKKHYIAAREGDLVHRSQFASGAEQADSQVKAWQAEAC